MIQNEKKWVVWWLWAGLLMILIQILLGAITRLTGSGLSIPQWDIIMGTFYPWSESDWLEKFSLYKQTPQYLKINQGMDLQDFKYIFFWEYFHRLWARIMGFCFIIPFAYFSWKGYLNKWIIVRLIVVFLMAVLVASLGWIMVASGLIERPWVNAFKLSFHLITAIILLCYLLWVILDYNFSNKNRGSLSNNFHWILLVGLLIQVFLGGIMSGMKAGLVAPTWPDINGHFWISGLDFEDLNRKDLITNYENTPVSPLIVQFLHRTWAYLIWCGVLLILIFYYKRNSLIEFKLWRNMLILISLQIVVGIITLLSCIGSVPVVYGVIHQLIGIICVLYSTYVCFRLRIID